MNGETQVLADRGTRLLAAIIDAILMMIILLPIMFINGVFQQLMSGTQLSLIQQGTYFVTGWVVFLALQGYLLYTKGQTIGKMFLKIKIVDLQGKLPAFGNLIFLRYFVLSLVSQVPLIGNLVGLVDVLFIFGKEKRCVHDYLAGTRVVNV